MFLFLFYLLVTPTNCPPGRICQERKELLSRDGAGDASCFVVCPPTMLSLPSNQRALCVFVPASVLEITASRTQPGIGLGMIKCCHFYFYGSLVFFVSELALFTQPGEGGSFEGEGGGARGFPQTGCSPPPHIPHLNGCQFPRKTQV